MPEHVSGLRRVEEGDRIKFTTTEGETFEGVCKKHTTEQADPRTGEVRETFMWILEVAGREMAVSITEGLKSSPDDPDFPVHSEVSDMQADDPFEYESKGYIESIEFLEEPAV